ncbi:hypothetical protein F4604DRAFT_374016 [Suillus subluteus]|nr:hypothetical protein F4604DRAFT_374016 [Suillus subluteus]
MKVTKHTSSSSRTPDKRWSMLGLRLEVDIQDFYQRLFDHNLIPDSQASKETSSRTICPCCPLCSHRLIACSSCSTVTCGANSRCVGANLVRVSRCYSYDTMMFCHDCLIYDSDDLGALGEYILCEVRYPPRVMTKFTEDNWKKCSEHTWRPREHDDPYICLDCIETIRSHVTCPCGLAWICGLCAQKEIQRSGRRCPRCQTFYCFRRCKYIRACTECRKRTLCKDCAEEEVPDEEGPSLSNKGSPRYGMRIIILQALWHGWPSLP